MAQAVLDAAAKRERQAGEASAYDDAVGAWDVEQAGGGGGGDASSSSDNSGAAGQAGRKSGMKVVLITGFESFNVELYKKAAVQLAAACPGISLRVFSDRDLGGWRGCCGVAAAAWLVQRGCCGVAAAACRQRPAVALRPLLGGARANPPPPLPPPAPPAGPRRQEVEAALAGADVFFGSLLFDYDQVEWLRARVGAIPYRLVFESSLELMSATQVGGRGGRATARERGASQRARPAGVLGLPCCCGCGELTPPAPLPHLNLI